MVFLHTLFYSLFQIAIRALLENKDSETVLLFDVVVENGLCIVTHMNGRLWLYMIKKFYAIVQPVETERIKLSNPVYSEFEALSCLKKYLNEIIIMISDSYSHIRRLYHFFYLQCNQGLCIFSAMRLPFYPARIIKGCI